MLSANMIGAGKLGKVLGYLLQSHDQITIQAICNRTEASAAAAVSFIGAGIATTELVDLPLVDLLFITTNDAAIEAICASLCEQPLKPGSIVMHCSGVLSSEVLSALRAKGVFVASVHPMKSFADPELSVSSYVGTYCSIEGDAKAVERLKPLFEAIGSVMIAIDGHKKALYHAAGVFASNYLVTLAHHALVCLEKSGIPRDVSQKLMLHLMQSTLTNLQHHVPSEALTGPLKRGDVSTILAHMDALEHLPQKSVYAVLGESTLAIVESLEPTIRQKLSEIFCVT